MTAIPYSEQLREIRREIAVRERVFPRWVENGKISQKDADRKLAIMRAVADTLAPLARGEELDL
jgi:hypothetical protein